MALQPKLHVIDLSSKNLKQGTPSWVSTCNTIRSALEEHGIFIIRYDKIASELHDKIFKLTEDMFDLPKEIKVKNTSDKLGFGYMANIPNMLIEYLGIDDAATLEGTKRFTDLLWPMEKNTFCETALLYSKLLSELGEMVIRMVFESYGAEEQSESHFESIFYLMRFMKYQLPASQSSVEYTGLHAHTDKSFWGILDQNQIKGLEVETKGGEWITFEPSASTFLFIAGEPFMAWSNGRIHPAYHRVTITKTEPKYSIGLFAFARGIVNVPEVLVDDDQHSLKFKPFDSMLFLKYCGEEGKKFKNAIIPYCGV